MELVTWFEQYAWALPFILFAVFAYYYFKNKNKKDDAEKIKWYRLTGMAFMGFILLSSCVIAVVVFDDPSKFNSIVLPVILISILLYAIASLYIGYKFRRKEKLNNNHFGSKEETS